MDNLIIVHEVSGLEFYETIKESLKTNPRSNFLTLYTALEYTETKKTIILNDNSAGICIKENGNIISVFKNYSTKKYVENALSLLMPIALVNGGTKLDCYGEGLTKKYMKYGFVPVAKCKFEKEFANKDWNYDLYGEPDIYFLCRWTNDLNKLIAQQNINHNTDTIFSELDSKLPYLSYEEGILYRDDILKYTNELELEYNELITLLKRND